MTDHLVRVAPEQHFDITVQALRAQMRKYWILGAAAVAFFLPSIASADCSDTVSQYNSALSDIESYAKKYFRCVAASSGQDDCSSEFRRLKNAQGDFELAVSSYRLDCNR